MTDEELKTLQVIVPSAFGVLVVLVTTIGGVIIAKINNINKRVNGLLSEKTLADEAKGKLAGIKQEKADQKDRDKKH